MNILCLRLYKTTLGEVMWSVSFVWHKCRMRAMPPFGRKSMADVFRMIKQLCCILIINTIVQFLVNCMFQPLDMFAPLVYGCFALQLLDPSARTPVSHRCVCVCVCAYTVRSMLFYICSAYLVLFYVVVNDLFRKFRAFPSKFCLRRCLRPCR